MADDDALFDKGMPIRREVLGPEYVDASMARADEFMMSFQRATTAWAWGWAWGDPTLDRKTRSLMNLAMLTALNRAPEIKLHVKGALTNGVTVEEIKATVADMQARRKSAQPTNKRTFGSVFKNPEHELSAGRMLEACGLRGFVIGGAQISPRHANFIENAGSATSADAIALIAEARRRAREQYGVTLEHEVEFLGALELPAIEAAAPAG